MWTDFQNSFTTLIRKNILYVHNKDFHLACIIIIIIKRLTLR